MAGRVRWQTDGLVDYASAMELMSVYVMDVAQGKREPFVWILQHPSVYTYGSSLVHTIGISHVNAPVVKVFRGGGLMYHGPGQIVVYPIIPLAWFNGDLHKYVSSLELWMMQVCAEFGVHAFTIAGHRGVFTDKGKIGFVGVSGKKHITMHGFSLNVFEEDEAFFNRIQPCGLEVCVTSLEKEAKVERIQDVVLSVQRHFNLNV